MVLQTQIIQYNMGQKNEVQVIRLVAKGTIEEKITELQMKKQNLIDEVIQSGEEPLKAMTEEVSDSRRRIR